MRARLASLRLVRAALRNYASPVFVRDNPTIISSGLFIMAVMIFMKPAAQVVARGGVRALLAGHSQFVSMWWMVTFFVPGSVTNHYWRQIKSNVATAIPGLAAAERAAVTIVLPGVFLLLASPFLWFGAPILGSFALTSIGLVMGGGLASSTPTGQSRGWGFVRAVLLLPILLVGFMPRYLAVIMFAPVPVDAVIVLIMTGIIASGLHYRPAVAAQQSENIDHQTDRATMKSRPSAPLHVAAGRIGGLLFWKPWFLSDLPVPAALNMPLGPIGIGVSIIVPTIMFTLFSSVLSWIGGTGFVRSVMTQGPQTMGIGISLSLLASGQWLLNRDDWPTLFMAGRYGGRRGFCRSMIQVQCLNIVQSCLWCALISADGGILFGVMRPDQAPLAALAVFGIMFGMSFMVGLPLLWRERGGKAATLAANLAGYMIAMMTIQSLIMRHGPTVLSLIIAATAVLFGIAMLRFIPARLAVMDWPIGADTPDTA